MRFWTLVLMCAFGAGTLRAEPGHEDERGKRGKGDGKEGREEAEKEEKRAKEGEEEEARRKAEGDLNWDNKGKNGGVSWPDIPDVDEMVESAQKAKCPETCEVVGGEPKPGIAGYEKDPTPLDDAEIEEAVDGSFGEEEGDASWLERK